MFGSETTDSSCSTFVTYINWSTQRARATKDWTWNWQTTSVAADTSRHTFILDKSTYKIYTNWTQIYSWSNGYTITKNWEFPLTIFATRNTAYVGYIEHSSAKLYSCKIYESGTLVRDFVPCYRKSDTEIWVYDLVTNAFFTNQGTGTFTKWNNVWWLQEKQVRAPSSSWWTLTDSFSWTSLDTNNWTIDYIASIWTVTVNNGITVSTNWAWAGNAWWPSVRTLKTLTGNEKKITVSYTVTSVTNWSISIWWQTFNRVSESSVYKCNWDLPLVEMYSNSSINVTKSSTTFSWNTNTAYNSYTYTAVQTPFTLTTELDLENRTVKQYNWTTLLTTWTIPSTVNLSDWVWKQVVAINAVWWNARSIALSNISITIE
jgi:hypothetical protein